MEGWVLSDALVVYNVPFSSTYHEEENKCLSWVVEFSSTCASWDISICFLSDLQLMRCRVLDGCTYVDSASLDLSK